MLSLSSVSTRHVGGDGHWREFPGNVPASDRPLEDEVQRSGWLGGH